MSLRKLLPTPRPSKTGVKGNQSILIHTANLLTKISNVRSMRREADEQKIVEVKQAPELVKGATAENSPLTCKDLAGRSLALVLPFLLSKPLSE